MEIESDSEDLVVCTPSDVREIPNEVTLHLLPQKSLFKIYESSAREKYIVVYKRSQ